MGTNYYGHQKVSIEQKNELAILILQGELILTRSKLEELTDKIHIGKSSAGWKFLFNNNRKTWKTFKKFQEWVNQFEIWDEYGSYISHEDFWAKVNSKQKDKSSIPYCTDLDGYDFSTSDDFS